MAKTKKPQVETNQEVEQVQAQEVQAEVKTPRMNIGKQVRELILTKPELTNTQILEEILKNNPTAKTTMACIAWYKSDMRKKGEIAQRAKAEPKAEEAQA